MHPRMCGSEFHAPIHIRRVSGGTRQAGSLFGVTRSRSVVTQRPVSRGAAADACRRRAAASWAPNTPCS
eukprot:4428703-Pyramimonas_sp.AAC.1